MAPVVSQLIEEVNAHAQRDSLEDAREICVDGTYFPNNLRTTRSYSRNTCDSFCLHIINSNKLFYPEYCSILGCNDVLCKKFLMLERTVVPSSSWSSHH